LNWRTRLSVAISTLGVVGAALGVYASYDYVPVLRELRADHLAITAEERLRLGDPDGGQAVLAELTALSPPRAAFERARLCMFGLIGSRSPEPDWGCAAEAFADAAGTAADPETQAKALLGLVDLEARGLADLDAEPISLLARATQLGNQKAATELAAQLFTTGSAREHELGVRLLRRASWSDPNAAIRLARLYQTGDEPLPSRLAVQDLVDRAHMLLLTDVATEKASHMLALGEFLNSDEFGQQDAAEALFWFDRAAARGSVSAMVIAADLRLDWSSTVFDLDDGLARLRRAAEFGSGAAAYRLGLTYKEGLLVGRDLTESTKWFARAAELGSNAAVVELAQTLLAQGDLESLTDAVATLEAAAMSGSADAALQLAELLEARSDLAAESTRPASSWYLAAARLGNRRAMAYLAEQFRTGSEAFPADHDAAIYWTRRAVESGHRGTSLIMALADAYRNGSAGLPRDTVQAVRLYEEAAQHGSTAGMLAIAEAYKTGIGVPVEPERSLYWFRRAAEAGSVKAIQELALAYASGFGTDVQPVEAVRLFFRAAQTGSRFAQRELGLIYSLGYGVEPNPVRALQYLQAAAAQGETDSMMEIAFAYREGFGVAVDREEAARWLMRAALLNDKNAQYLLGRAYLEGDGVMRDPVLARNWLLLARSLGSNAAEGLLLQLDAEQETGPEG
jgi:TPR repeat protein